MKRLVLVGAGHAHVLVLKAFIQGGIKDVEIMLVSPVVLAPYSGLIPGWLAGVYQWEECCVDFAYLCHRPGAILRVAAIAGLDSARSELVLECGERVRYDWLSINIGSTLTPPSGDHPAVLPMRPLSDLKARWEGLLQTISHLAPGSKYRIVMVGGGAAGVESILAANNRLTQLAPDVRFNFRLAIQGDDILPGMAAGAAKRMRVQLARRQIDVVNQFLAERVERDAVVSMDGRVLPAEAILWATGAQSFAWPKNSGLSLPRCQTICRVSGVN